MNHFISFFIEQTAIITKVNEFCQRQFEDSYAESWW